MSVHARRPVRRSATGLLVSLSLLATACGSTAHRDRVALRVEQASGSETGTTGSTGSGSTGGVQGSTTSNGTAVGQSGTSTGEPGTTATTGPDGSAATPGTTAPGTGGSTTGSPTGTTPGGSGAPAAGSNNLPQTTEHGRGATPDTIKVGLTYITSFQSLGSSLGFTIPAKGDIPAQAQILEDWINDNGGIAGRELTVVLRGFKQEESAPGVEQQLCNALADDEQVFAAALIGMVQESTRHCFASKGVLAIDISTYTFDSTAFAETSPYLWSLEMANYTNLARTLPGALDEENYFAPMASRNETETKVGVLIWDSPFAKRIVARDLEPALAAVGQDIDVLATVDGASIGTIQKGLSDGVVKFRDAGVNRVMFIGGAPLQPFFYQTAENESFRPRYGVTSIDQPRYAATESEGGYPLQAVDMIGIGVAPDVDVDDDQFPMPMNDTERECLEVVGRKGHTHAARKNANVMLGLCGALLMLQRGAVTITDGITQRLWAAHAEQNLRVFESPLNPISDYGPGDYSGPNTYRPMRWFEDCTCIRYTGSSRPLK